jgi:uncharacterized membrane protein
VKLKICIGVTVVVLILLIIAAIGRKPSSIYYYYVSATLVLKGTVSRDGFGFDKKYG